MTPRVAFVIPYLRSRGGWQTAAVGAVRALARHVEPVLVVAHADLEAARALLPGYETHILPDIQPLHAGLWPVARTLAVANIGLRRLPRLRIDLVHALEAFPAGGVARALARREGVPFGLTAHGTYAVVWKRWPLLASAYARVLREAAFVCPISHGTLTRMQREFGAALNPPMCEVVIEGTDITERVGREEATARQWPQLPSLTSVGNLKPRKGYHFSLLAFARVRRSLPQARYQIIGGGLGGAYHERLMALIQQHHIRGVEFVGSVGEQDLASRYRSCSVFALLSQEQRFAFEGFGLVFLEAGAYGLPVVGSRTGGIPDAVRDGETGYLVGAEDVEGAGEAMLRLLTDEDLARRMGRAGRERAESLTWSRYAAQQSEVYLRTFAVKSGGAST
jgi:phosphatidylinositol alpha-1,6-mannosyltransferase